MKNVKIYQMKEEVFRSDRSYMFLPWRIAKKYFDKADYELVFDTYRDDDYTLDACYREFNVNRPEGFEGHSLSMSDLIEMDSHLYYVDSFGFTEVE